MGGNKKKLEMGDRFVTCRSLVPLPTISRERVCVKNELLGVINHLFYGLWRGSGVDVDNCVFNMPPDNLDGVSGGVRLAEALVVYEPVCVRNHGVRHGYVVEKIHHTGSAVA